ncbi:hypothetical protein GCM10009678_56590 [Actinomadura kijaniata]
MSGRSHTVPTHGVQCTGVHGREPERGRGRGWPEKAMPLWAPVIDKWPNLY